MGPELPSQPAEHQRTEPPAENHEHVQRAAGIGMSHQGQGAQHTPRGQARRRDSTTPCQKPHCEIRVTDVAALSQVHSEEDHHEPENRVGDSDDAQSNADSAPQVAAAELRNAQTANQPATRQARTQAQTETVTAETWTDQPKTTPVSWTRARREKNARKTSSPRRISLS
jgi:hypothetical protein